MSQFTISYPVTANVRVTQELFDEIADVYEPLMVGDDLMTFELGTLRDLHEEAGHKVMAQILANLNPETGDVTFFVA